MGVNMPIHVILIYLKAVFINSPGADMRAICSIKHVINTHTDNAKLFSV